LYSNEKNGLQQLQVESCQPFKKLKEEEEEEEEEEEKKKKQTKKKKEEEEQEKGRRRTRRRRRRIPYTGPTLQLMILVCLFHAVIPPGRVGSRLSGLR
jgi:hypothetical protein